jgi:hypothetical protein
MLANNGEIGEPCGVPDPVSVVTPSSSTPTRSQQRSSFSIRRSATRRATWPSSASWSMEPKQSRTSASSPQSAPRLASALMASHAWWAERRGRNPKLTGSKSASNTGSRTSFAAVIATRSRTVGMPSGRVLPGWPGLGMWTRRSGAGR